MAENSRSDDRFVMAGWILFLIGCAMFVAAGIRSRDLLSTAASGLFFLGCVLFLIPMLRSK